MNELNRITAQYSILDRVPDGLCLLQQDFTVLFWNRYLENWTKIYRHEILGTNLYQHFPHLKESRYRHRLQQVFTNGFPVIFSPQLHPALIPCFLPNGQPRIQQVTVTAVPSPTTAETYALMTIQDVTDLTHRITIYQQELKQRQRIQEELERSNTELESFAYIASHDLREPLRMVVSFTQLLGQRYKGKLDEDADRIIDFAVEGATRMQVLINDLLTYSRVNTKNRNFQTVDCNESLNTAIQNIQLAIAETESGIECHPLPTIFADAAQLVQLFQNLLDNAIKYRSSDRAPRIEVGSQTRKDHYLFWVKDNGIGIADKHGERIFRIFQRLHTRTAYPGTGIGLAICEKIVQRHGGEIWVESELGRGSTFYFTIPQQFSP